MAREKTKSQDDLALKTEDADKIVGGVKRKAEKKAKAKGFPTAGPVRHDGYASAGPTPDPSPDDLS